MAPPLAAPLSEVGGGAGGTSAAAAVHDGLLALTLTLATCGRGEAASAAAAEHDEEEAAEEAAEAAAVSAAQAVREADELLLQSRFVQRQADMQLEARLKSASGGAHAAPKETPPDPRCVSLYAA